jgi:hypothetical protein
MSMRASTSTTHPVIVAVRDQPPSTTRDYTQPPISANVVHRKGAGVTFRSIVPISYGKLYPLLFASTPNFWRLGQQKWNKGTKRIK